jgi:hypothetical protein
LQAKLHPATAIVSVLLPGKNLANGFFSIGSRAVEQGFP